MCYNNAYFIKEGDLMSDKTKKIVFTALFAALSAVATLVISIPSPMQGYVHLGDCIVLLCGWTLGPIYGTVAAGVGSALADIIAGYTLYAPITLVIKGSVALLAYYIRRLLLKRVGNTVSLIISATLAELLMIGGYYLFEGIVYGFIPSLVNIPANAMQALSGVVFGSILMSSIGKHITFYLNK